MMKRATLAAMVAALLQPYTAQAADDGPRILSANTDWLLDFGEERCSLIREFSDGADTIRLQIESYGPAPGYRVTISGDLVAGSDAAPITEFRVGYSPDTDKREAMSMVVGRLGDQKAISFGPGFLPDAPWSDVRGREFERGVRGMTVDFKGRRPFRLETGSMADPFVVMHQCVDDLVGSWGIDPETHRTLSRPPMLLELPEGYRTVEVDLEESHPGPTERRYRPIAEEQARRRAGPVPRAGYASPIRVMIDAAGQQTECVAQVASVSEETRQTICERFAGPYQPALDAEGRPVASFVQWGTSASVIQVAAN